MSGRGVGGFKEFAQGGNYGCCACIGAAGTALYPLYAFVERDDTVYCNFFLNGDVEFVFGGNKVRVECVTEYPAKGQVKLTVHTEEKARFALAVRIPDWCEKATVFFDGKTFAGDNGYVRLDREWQNGDEVVISLSIELKEVTLNGKTAFTYGTLVLARDEAKEKGDITEKFAIDKEPSFRCVTPEQGEQLRLFLETKDGDILLTDYASCGKNWKAARNRITVWMN